MFIQEKRIRIVLYPKHWECRGKTIYHCLPGKDKYADTYKSMINNVVLQ